MAVVKFEFHDCLKKSVEYAAKDRGDDDVVSAENCDLEKAYEQFRNTKKIHDKMTDYQTLMLIQSFPPKERNMKTPEEFHEMGKKLANTLFPGFETVIRTHTDKGHIHNHICINTVHRDTGVRICDEKLWGSVFGPPTNKSALSDPHISDFAKVYFDSKSSEAGTTRWLHKLRSTNDMIAREAGLSVLDGTSYERSTKVPQKVMRMEQFKKDSWVLDLMQKATHARGLATSYDEYSAILKETFNIDVRVENKNIVYSYPGKQKRVKRGKKLGTNFDKEGLERNFEHNDRMFANHPELRNKRREEFNALAARPGHIVRDSSGVLLEPDGARTIFTKDYSAFTPTARPGRTPYSTSDRELSGGIIPLSEIRRAKGSIPEYCKENKIALMTDEKGRTVLKGRGHVVINEFDFLNTKSNVQGNLINFVAIHHNCSFLQAVAKINGNGKLLILEKYIGERKRSFNAFYIPKQDKHERDGAVSQISNLFKSFGASGKSARLMHDNGQAQVSKSGVIRIFPKDDDSATLEFISDGKGSWKESSRGKARHPFFVSKPQGNKVHVFIDPKVFIKKHGEKAFQHGKEPRGILALLSPDTEALDTYVAEHKHLSKVVLMFSNSKPSQAELDFFGVLKKHYEPHGIIVSHAGMEKTITREGPDLSI